MNRCRCGCNKRCRNTFVHGHNSKKIKRFRKQHTGFEIAGKRSVCWLWLLAQDKDGYGVSWKNGKSIRAHVELYEEEYGKVPSGLQLDHLCRIRACCRPEHCEAVTSKVNTRRAKTKVTMQIVRHIKKLYGKVSFNGKGRTYAQWTQKELAKKFGLCSDVVFRILHGSFDDLEEV